MRPRTNPGFALPWQARRYTSAESSSSRTDRSFASRCSQPHFAMTQSPSATWPCALAKERTLTSLMLSAHGRTRGRPPGRPVAFRRCIERAQEHAIKGLCDHPADASAPAHNPPGGSPRMHSPRRRGMGRRHHDSLSRALSTHERRLSPLPSMRNSAADAAATGLPIPVGRRLPVRGLRSGQPDARTVDRGADGGVRPQR